MGGSFEMQERAMSDTSLFIRLGELQIGAVGPVGIGAVVVLALMLLGARWRGIL